MDEKEKSQKTIIAVITGLLIGGLLVWIFSAAPDDATPEENAATGTTEEVSTDVADDTDEPEAEDANVSPSRANGGSIRVANQPAGAVVELTAIEYPHNAGWIVVREELAGGVLGNILGASRFNKMDGLNPTNIQLLRNTEAGKVYHVIAYTENGDRVFDLADDVPVTLTSGALLETTFTAQ